jgi:predicted metal-dependent phosphoesterase TrpH
MEDIIATLNESKIDLSEEGREAKTQYDTVTALCTSSKQAHRDAIEEAKEQISTWQQIQRVAEADLNNARATLMTREGELTAKTAELDTKTIKRENDH